MSAPRYNSRSPAVKRLLREAAELHEPTRNYFAQPLEENLFEWHFTIRGPDDTPFANGIYHGRIVLPPEYPMKPPNVIFLTPNGRFEIHKKICLSISGYHPETWRPSWSIRTALLALIGFMPTHGNGAIGSLDYTDEERKRLALRSRSFICDICGPICDLLLDESSEEDKDSEEIKEYAAQLTMTKPTETNQENAAGDNIPTDQKTDANDNIPPEEQMPQPLSVEDIAPEPPAPEVTRPRNSEDLSSFILMWILTLAILFLIYRRLQRHFDLDLVDLVDGVLTSLLPH